MKKKIFAVAAAAVIAARLPAAYASETGKETVNVYVNTFEEHQTIVGVGGAITWYNDWLSNNPNREEIYKMLFEDAGLDVIRIKNFYEYSGADFKKSAAADKENITSAERFAGKDIPVLMSSWSPEAAIKSNGSEAGHGTIKKDGSGAYMYDEFGDYFAEMTEAYRDAGVDFDYLSIQNEPDFAVDYDGCELSAAESAETAQYSKAFDAAYDAVQKLEDPPVMIGPETMTASSALISNYIDPILEHGDGRLGAIAHHLYAGGSETDPDQYIRSMNRLRDNYPDIPKWQTEYYRGDMVQTAWLISNTFTEEDAEAYIYWDTVWGNSGAISLEDPWKQDEWITEKGYTVTDKYYALAHFAKFTDSGYVRTDASVDYQNDYIKTAAFNSPDKSKLTVVITNTSDTDTKINLDLNGYIADRSEIYLSDGGEGGTDRMAPKGALGADGETEIPAWSVMTIDISGRQGEKPSVINEGEPAPKRVSNKVTAVYGTPVVDGTADDIWDNCEMQRILNVAHGDHGASGTFKTMWDENNLYLLINVNDEQLDDSSEVEFECDSVEIFINEDHSKPDMYGPGDSQYRVDFRNRQSFGSRASNADGFKTAVTVTGGGYIVEAAVPFKTIKGEQGRYVGLDVQINDSHGTGTRDYILKWSDPSDNTWSSLAEIGDCELIGSLDRSKKVTVTLDGEQIIFQDQEPIIVNDRVLLPIRAVAEAAGFEVEWDGENYNVIIKRR